MRQTRKVHVEQLRKHAKQISKDPGRNPAIGRTVVYS
jgi:hypothetical protein